MTSATPLVGPVYGFRTWNIAPGYESEWIVEDTTPQLTSRGTTWDSPRQVARCVTDDNSMGTILATALFGKRERTVSEPHDPVSRLDCWCGLYAHSTLGRCLEDRASYFRDSLGFIRTSSALGLVSAAGRIIAADRGFRAERMAIDTLVCLHPEYRTARHPLFGPHQPHIRQIAKSLGVRHVCARLNRKSLSAAFAGREGVYLWRTVRPRPAHRSVMGLPVRHPRPGHPRQPDRRRGDQRPRTGTPPRPLHRPLRAGVPAACAARGGADPGDDRSAAGGTVMKPPPPPPPLRTSRGRSAPSKGFYDPWLWSFCALSIVFFVLLGLVTS